MAEPSSDGQRLLRGPSSFPRMLSRSVEPYWQVVRLLPGLHLTLTTVVAVGVMLGAALPLAITIAIGQLVGEVPAAVAGGPNSTAAQAAIGWLVLVGALFLSSQAVLAVRAAAAFSLGRRLNEHLRERVMVALNRPVGISLLEEPKTQDLIQQAQDLAGFGYSPCDAVEAMANLCSRWLLSIAYAVLLATFSVPLAIGLLLITAVAGHFQRREYLLATQVSTNQARFLRRADYLRNLVLTPTESKEVRVWGLVDWLIDRFIGEWRRVMEPIWAERARGNRLDVVSILLVALAQFSVLAIIALAAANGDIGLAALVAYVGAVQGVTAILARGIDDFALALGTASVPAALELERLAAETEAHETIKGLVSAADMPARDIRFEGVSFSYPSQAAAVLRDLDLFIPAGQSLAIVGANGAGKTTLVKLLGRLYDPSEGRITVDGVDLREIEPQGWRKRVAAIFQDFIQYQLSVRDNVTFGAVDLAGDEDAMIAAARWAGALEFVEALPLGWETTLSRQYTDGAELSGGQWQRLALARALFAVSAGSSVLIMDEPTANLDVRAEAAFYDSFLEITKGLTTVIISHRFSTVRRAERIVVLDGGLIVEDGPHDTLLAANGLYAEMFNLQASRFEEDAADV